MDTTQAAHRAPATVEVMPLITGGDPQGPWAIVAVGEFRARYTVPVSQDQAQFLGLHIGQTVRLTISTAALDEPSTTDEDTVSFIASQAAQIRSLEEIAVQLTALLWDAAKNLPEGVTRAHVQDALLQSPYVSGEDKARLRVYLHAAAPLPAPKSWSLDNVRSILRNCAAGAASDAERRDSNSSDAHAYRMRRDAFLFAIELLEDLRKHQEVAGG